MYTMQVDGVLRAILGKSVTAEEPLTVAGLDSLGAVEVQKELSRYKQSSCIKAMKAAV